VRGQAILAEALGSLLLFATVIGSGIMAERLADGNVAIALLGNTLATGAILFVLITMLGPISGAHLNPAVTLVMHLRGFIRTGMAAIYVAAQLAGGILGVWIAHIMFAVPVFQLSGELRSGPGQLMGEGLATFGLLLTILGTAKARPSATPASVALYHRRLLVHFIHQLRQSGDHHRPIPERQLCRHRARLCACVHRSTACRRAGGPPSRQGHLC